MDKIFYGLVLIRIYMYILALEVIEAGENSENNGHTSKKAGSVSSSASFPPSSDVLLPKALPVPVPVPGTSSEISRRARRGGVKGGSGLVVVGVTGGPATSIISRAAVSAAGSTATDAGGGSAVGRGRGGGAAIADQQTKDREKEKMKVQAGLEALNAKHAQKRIERRVNEKFVLFCFLCLSGRYHLNRMT